MLKLGGTTADSYTEGNVYQYPNTVAGRLSLASFGRNAIVQMVRGRWGDPTELEEETLGPGSYIIAKGADPIYGIRLRSAMPGLPVDYTGALYLAQDPPLLASTGAPVTTSGGGGGGGGSGTGVTGDIVWSAASSRTGALFCDGTHYDSVADPNKAALFAAIGTIYGGAGASDFAVPDLRGRAPVMIGTRSLVDTLGKSDGTPLANRSPSHGHTEHLYSPGFSFGGVSLPFWSSGPPTTSAPIKGGSGDELGGGIIGDYFSGQFDFGSFLVLNAFILL